jgi:hypothetical protein
VRSAGAPLSVSQRELPILASLGKELGNKEIVLQASTFGPLTVGNAVTLFQIKRRLGGDFLAELKFVCEHFTQITESELELEDMELVLGNQSLVAQSEDSLYDLISGHLSEDFGWFRLFELIHFEFLSVSRITQFIDLTQVNSVLISGGVWAAVCRRLAVDVSQGVYPRFGPKTVRCNFAVSSPLSGIIAHLTSRFGKNVAEAGIVSVTSKTVDDRYPLKNVVDLTGDTKFSSQTGPNQYICYDFRSRRVIVTHYTIRSLVDQGPGSCHLKSWALDGSNDGTKWTRLHEETNNGELNGMNRTKSWQTTTQVKSRFIRLSQTGVNWHVTDQLMLSAFEIFGTLHETE